MAKKYLGNFLRKLREDHAPPLKQQDVADAISEKSVRKITQGLVAQYETGKVILPDALILKHLAKFFNIGCGKLVFLIALDIVEKYKEDVEFNETEQEQLETWRSVLKHIDPDPGFEDNNFEQEVLRSTRNLSEKLKILDIEALAKWQKHLDPLDEFWVISPIFIDNTNCDILETVLHNISRDHPVKYLYFVNKKDTERGGKFSILRNTLTRLGANLEKPLKHAHVDKLIQPVGIPQEDIGLLQTDIIIANPQSLNPLGYRSIRYDGVPAFGVPISSDELSMIIGQMTDYITNIKEDSNILPITQKRGRNS